jgi:hypothetical protein
MTKLIFKALYMADWPSYLPLEVYKPGRSLRSSSELKLVNPLVNGTFQHTASKNLIALQLKLGLVIQLVNFIFCAKIIS